jgi:primosomal protein N'
MLHAPAPSEQSTTPAITNNMRDRLDVPVSELVTTLASRKRKSDFAKTLKDEKMPGAG